MAESLDLVCGPADPLPESSQSFRLIAPLGQGGQADVYKAVRRSAGVSSAPVTLKVFRPSSNRSLDAQFRSWDKGDAVLMDLGGRNVTGICRRIDAFYGPPPHRPGTPAPRESVPYQVLEYLPGKDLRQLLSDPNRPTIDARRVLDTVIGVLQAMHDPVADAHPALHMDIKPSNIIVTPAGEVKVIDFTGSRYFAPTHITTISYTPEAAGPEARDGRVGPSYDVHGFGSIAFFMLTGAKPRSGATVVDAPSTAAMHSHPVLTSNKRLRDHLLTVLADTPSSRPYTRELRRWTDELFTIVASSRVPDLRVGWGAPARSTARIPIPSSEPTTLVSHAPAGGATRPMNITATAPVSPAARPVSGGGFGRGVAVPTAPKQRDADSEPTPVARDEPAEPKRPWTGPDGKLSILSSGSEFSVVGALFAFVGWGLWAFDNARGTFLGHILMFIFVLLVGAAVFTMARLLGTMVLVRLLNRTRRTARLSHLASGAFLVIVGLSFLSNVSYISTAMTWLQQLW
ncbi:serine/threonine protein kinase [Stackebrandtia soli]|uniref:serine/threonine protein kinase n=1 Tax=Stackebrandtia soli TaxID=1892856 RepID=UPI0039EAF75F